MNIRGSLVSRVAIAILLAAALGCAARAPSIAQLKADPRYNDDRVSVQGVVTTSWGVPLLPVRLYKIDDGTGELTVVSREGRRTPGRGARVEVKGRLSELAVFGGAALGLHLQEDSVRVIR